MRIASPRALLAALVVAVAGAPIGTGGPAAAAGVDDVQALFARLSPGMPQDEVAAVAGRAQLATAPAPVSSWLIWSPLPGGRGTAVLRAAFRDGRLARIEYEAFGDEYRRLVKGADPVEMPGDELARIWRQGWEVERLAERCRTALDAYHQLVVGAQERLTAGEQQAWARALEFRRLAVGAGPAR